VHAYSACALAVPSCCCVHCKYWWDVQSVAVLTHFLLFI